MLESQTIQSLRIELNRVKIELAQSRITIAERGVELAQSNEIISWEYGGRDDFAQAAENVEHSEEILYQAEQELDKLIKGKVA